MRKEKILPIIYKVKSNIAKLTMMLLIASGILVTGIGCDASPSNWPRESFTPKAWNASSKEKRFVFYNDLASTKKLNGLSKNDVLGLLGQPDYTAPDGKYFGYILKNAEKGEYSFNSVYILEIDFDAQGKVAQYFVRGD